MASVVAQIDGSWDGQTLQFSCWRSGSLLGAQVYAASLATDGTTGVLQASATIDMSGFGSGFVEIILTDTSTPAIEAWRKTEEIDSDGDIVVSTATQSLTAIQAKTDLIGSFGATVPVRYVGTGIQLYVGERQPVVITTTTDLSAKTLSIEFDDRGGTSVATIADGSITKTSTTLTFSATAAMTAAAQTLSYSVRDTTTKEVFVYGKCAVDYQPLT